MKQISLFLFTLFVFLNFIACKDTNTTIKENPPTNTVSIEENINKVSEEYYDEEDEEENEYNILVAAACNGQNDLVKETLEKDTSAINKSGWINDTVYTPLSCALQGGSAYNGQYSPKHKEVVKTLIAYGANVNLPDPSGQDPVYNTPLELAAYTNDLETLKLLIDNGADVTPMFRIIEFHKTFAKIVITRSGVGNYALKIAERNGNTEMVKLLLDAGANKNKKDEYNQLIDEQKIEGTYSEIAKKLKAAKAMEEKALLEKESSRYTKNNLPEWWIEDYNRNLHHFSELEEVMKDIEKQWNKN